MRLPFPLPLPPGSPTRALRAVLATWLLLAIVSGPARVHADATSSTRWWLNPTVQQELALTQVQVQALQRSFDRGVPERLALRRELDRLEDQLRQLLERGDVDDLVAERLITRVEQVRARRNVRRTLILLEMYRILTPTQRVALTKLRAR